MSGTWASGWALNDIVTVSEFAKGVGCVADSTLGAGAASIDFSGIPTTYGHLLIIVQARSDTAATATNLLLRFNNDSGTNYDTQLHSGSAAASTAAELFAGSAMTIGAIAAATAGAGLAGTAVIFVPNYAGTTFNKTANGNYDNKIGTATANMTVGRIAGQWRSTAAINRVTIFATAGNLVTGSRVGVYVMGA